MRNLRAWTTPSSANHGAVSPCCLRSPCLQVGEWSQEHLFYNVLDKSDAVEGQVPAAQAAACGGNSTSSGKRSLCAHTLKKTKESSRWLSTPSLAQTPLSGTSRVCSRY